jgi:hypothetical protein
MPLRHRASLVLALATVAVAVVPPGTAFADCQPAGPLEQELPTAAVAFVGRVVATDGPVARFAVSEVWAGPVGAEVEVRGLSDEPARPGEGIGRPAVVVGEDDRTWEAGATYLVLPFVDGHVLRDHLCTATTRWIPELADLRPSDARIVAASESSGGVSTPPSILALGAAVAAIGLVAVAAFRTRDQPGR